MAIKTMNSIHLYKVKVSSFSVKDQIVNTFSFVGHVVISYNYSKPDTIYKRMSIFIKLDLQKQQHDGFAHRPQSDNP